MASYVRAPQRRHQRFAGAPEFGERASPQPGPCVVCPPPRVTDPAQTVDAAAGRKPDDERADLPGLRGSLISPFPPPRAATPAPRSRHAGCCDPAAADMFDFRPVSGEGAVPSSARPVCGLPGGLAQDSTSAISRRSPATTSVPSTEAAPRDDLASVRRHAPGRLDQAAVQPPSGPSNPARRPWRP